MKLKIQVTKQHIKDAMFCGDNNGQISTNCAVALACRGVFPHCRVRPISITPFFGNDYTSLGTIILPTEVTKFINNFDELAPEQRLQLPELTFTIDIPDSVIDRIDISAVERSETLGLLEA